MKRLILSTLGAAFLLVAPASAQFADPGKTLSDLLHIKNLYAFGILENDQASRALHKLAGKDFSKIESVIQVAGPVTVLQGRYILGQGCRAHQCDTTVGTVIVDAEEGRVYAAILDGAKRAAWPRDMSKWPDAVRTIVQTNVKSIAGNVLASANALDLDEGTIGKQSAVEVVALSSLDGIPYDHNGSVVIVDSKQGIIAYAEPKSSIRGSIKPGTVLFRGNPWNTDGETAGILITGSARVFKKGCKAAEYEVRGLYSQGGGLQEFKLEGSSPVRSKTGCALTGSTINSPNAVLKFSFYEPGA